MDNVMRTKLLSRASDRKCYYELYELRATSSTSYYAINRLATPSQGVTLSINWPVDDGGRSGLESRSDVLSIADTIIPSSKLKKKIGCWGDKTSRNELGSRWCYEVSKLALYAPGGGGEAAHATHNANQHRNPHQQQPVVFETISSSLWSGATLAVDWTADDVKIEVRISVGIPRPRKMNFTTPAIMVRTMDPCMDMGDGQPMDPEACALKGNTSNTCTCTNMSMGMDMDMDMGMSMNMYFTFTKDATILFEKWQVDTAGGLAASAVVIFVLAVLYEGLKFFRRLPTKITKKDGSKGASQPILQTDGSKKGGQPTKIPQTDGIEKGGLPTKIPQRDGTAVGNHYAPVQDNDPAIRHIGHMSLVAGVQGMAESAHHAPHPQLWADAGGGCS
ncbi:unnamed protein product [Timema podura]|uniref:Copper transport protein n=1 Tax=Timema podura TaxID=61482 RepID=A0ABN7NIU6_TIMPD|nr:unnamed protein product [Timema podura]